MSRRVLLKARIVVVLTRFLLQQAGLKPDEAENPTAASSLLSTVQGQWSRKKAFGFPILDWFDDKYSTCADVA
jgi:hypothetical protein